MLFFTHSISPGTHDFNDVRKMKMSPSLMGNMVLAHQSSKSLSGLKFALQKVLTSSPLFRIMTNQPALLPKSWRQTMWMAIWWCLNKALIRLLRPRQTAMPRNIRVVHTAKVHDSAPFAEPFWRIQKFDSPEARFPPSHTTPESLRAS